MHSNFVSSASETRFGRRLLCRALALLICGLPASLFAGTFGTVVPTRGQVADIALDEARGVVYAANYTANRIDVVSIKDRKVVDTYWVSNQPSSLALSPDGRYLVILHLSNFATAPNNGITVLDLNNAPPLRLSSTLDAPPLAVEFTPDGEALVVTTKEFLMFDPATTATRHLMDVSDLTAQTLPVDAPTTAHEVIRASVSKSGDGKLIWGTIEGQSSNQTLLFEYDSTANLLRPAHWISTPDLLPRTLGVDRTGTRVMAGWGLFHGDRGFLLAQYPNDYQGTSAVGTHAIDTLRGVIYSQMVKGKYIDTKPDPVCSVVGGVTVCVTPNTSVQKWVPNGDGPTLNVLDADNLTILERLNLRENLTGRSILTSRSDLMIAPSDSGVMFLPIGALNQQNRVKAAQEQLAFKGNWCVRGVSTQDFDVINPGGGTTDFTVSTDMPGVKLSVSSNTTPAKVHVSLDASQYQNIKGTATGKIHILSSSAVNIPDDVTIQVNNKEPDQRGTFFSVAGKLVDAVADPARNRFYILRQDKNQLMVFDATNFKQIGALKTGNTPVQMAITFDRKYMIVTADNSQVANVYNLDTMQFDRWIEFPTGHYPRSIAASGRAILAVSRDVNGKHAVDRVDLAGVANTLPSLGVWTNEVSQDTVLAASPSGEKILLVEPDGTVMLYDATLDSFEAARQDFQSLGGAYAAISDDLFAAGDNLLGPSLYPMGTLESASGNTSGFAVLDQQGIRTMAASPSSPGVIERVDLTTGASLRPTRLTEAPVLGDSGTSPFTRTLVPLPNHSAIVYLSTSGFTVLPWEFDAAVADPHIDKVVSFADKTENVAPGALVSIIGTNLSPINTASSEIPLPTALGDSCLTLNGILMPIIFVSPTQVNGQIPFQVSGTASMILRTPAGVSNTFSFPLKTTAPGVFRTSVEGWDGEVPTVVRASNNLIVTLSNPIHTDDWIVIYLTGLGPTTPAVDSGAPGPSEPPAELQTKPTVTLGGVDLPVAFAGMAPGQVGVYQINAQVPFKGVPTGMEVPLTITQGDASTTVNVRVVK